MASSLPNGQITEEESREKPVAAAQAAPFKAVKGAGESAGTDVLVATLTAWVSELEDQLSRLELDSNNRTLRARIQRLEQDVATYREARETADFAVIDLRATVNRSAALTDALRVSPAYRLGRLLIEAGHDWRCIAGLPRALVSWRRENLRLRQQAEGHLVPDGSTTDYTLAMQRTLELAEKSGLEKAERWIVDQHLPAPVMARALSELAAFARKSNTAEAVRLAEAALEMDPHENRVKRLAFVMAEAGSIVDAAQLLRSAIGKGAKFNATEEARTQELLGLAGLASDGLTLMPARKRPFPEGAVTPRVVIFSSQAFPYHWTSISIRTHAIASSLLQRGVEVDVVTAPGYPDAGKALEDRAFEHPRVRTIDGVSYHLLPHTNDRPGVSDLYFKQASLALISFVRRMGATVLLAPSELILGYPAAVASQVVGARLVLDCWSVGPEKDLCLTERGRVLSEIQDALFGHAQAILARTPAIAARLGKLPQKKVHLAFDDVPANGEAQCPGDSDERAEFVFGYVGDNNPNVDIESLADLMNILITQGVEAKLAIHAVGSRISALRDQLEFAGHGGRTSVVSKSPPGRRMDLVYRGFDVLVAPFKMDDEAISAPFQIVAALRHNKCVVVIGAEQYKDLFGSAVVFAEDVTSAADILAAFSEDPDLRRAQEAKARAWNMAHPGGQGLMDAIEST